jgi:hypothetical protein
VPQIAQGLAPSFNGSPEGTVAGAIPQKALILLEAAMEARRERRSKSRPWGRSEKKLVINLA